MFIQSSLGNDYVEKFKKKVNNQTATAAITIVCIFVFN